MDIVAQLVQKKTNDSKYWPLSFGQQGLWFLYKLVPQSWAYNVLFTARIRDDVDIAALQGAFQALIDRHPSLRTTYTVRDSRPIQQVHDRLKVYFEDTDARAWSQDQLNNRLIEEARRPFDLERGPLLRVNLFTQSATEHILMLAVHQIAVDFWSLTVLLDELRVLYPCQKAGIQAPLPPLDLQYTDYVRWQAEMLAGAEGERWAYWQRQLAGSLPVLNLPTDRPRPPVQTYCGARHAFKLSEELTRQIEALAPALEATVYMTLLAAFQVLLYRYTAQEDILVGSPTTGRSQPEFSGIVGNFINLVVLRAELSGNPTFKTFLAQVRHTVLAALKHEDYPFELLVERLNLTQDSSRSPFQVMFILRKLHRFEELSEFISLSETEARIDFGGLSAEAFALVQQEGQVDLTLEMIETGGALFGVLKYNQDLFDACTVQRMAGHFQTLLEGIVANPEQHISTLPLLSAAERHTLLVEWNDTQVDYPKDVCSHQLFEAQVKRTPDAIAVVFADDHLTYRELNAQANQLAHYLRNLGVGPEVLVAICFERSLLMLVGILGILKAGGAYVPLDPAYPKERLAFMLEDTQAPVLLTQERLLKSLPEHPARVVCLDTDWEGIVPESQENPASGVTADNLAYVIYTSGSTGKPKGTLITHQGLVNYLSWCTQAYAVEQGQRVPVQSSIAFDATITSLFAPLLVGSLVQLLPEDLGIEALSIVLQNSSNYSLVKITPAQLELLARQLPPEKASGRTRAFIIGGENLVAEGIAYWQNVAPETKLVNEYGPTETVVGCCIYQVTNGKHYSGSIPIGRPIANTQIYLLDQHLQPVPIGIPGELYIGGAGLARGYLNRPELTAEKFIPNPFGDARGARLYKSGDLARYLPSGDIEYLGRIDNQVKIRGFRIELGEIEALLRQHPLIEKTVVVAREDEPGNKRLVAYFVPNSEQAPSISELRSFLKQKLPEYLVPNAFVLLLALPLTSNGKVDRKALPAPEQVWSELEATFVAPRTSTEEVIARIWAEVLGLEQVGIHNNFFELGGHSLLLTQVTSRLHNAFQVELSVRQLFEAPTVADSAVIITQKLVEQADSEMLEQMLAELEQLPEDEVQAVLIAEK